MSLEEEAPQVEAPKLVEVTLENSDGRRFKTQLLPGDPRIEQAVSGVKGKARTPAATGDVETK